MSIPIIVESDPGHDDAIALLLALASPEVELPGVTTAALQARVWPGLVTTVARDVEVELGPTCAAGERWSISGSAGRRAVNAQVGIDLAAAAFFDLLVERMARLGQGRVSIAERG